MRGTTPTGGHQVVAEVFVPGPKAPLNAPHGGRLVNVMATPERAEEVCCHNMGLCILLVLREAICRGFVRSVGLWVEL